MLDFTDDRDHDKTEVKRSIYFNARRILLYHMYHMYLLYLHRI